MHNWLSRFARTKAVQLQGWYGNREYSSTDQPTWDRYLDNWSRPPYCGRVSQAIDENNVIVNVCHGFFVTESEAKETLGQKWNHYLRADASKEQITRFSSPLLLSSFEKRVGWAAPQTKRMLSFKYGCSFSNQKFSRMCHCLLWNERYAALTFSLLLVSSSRTNSFQDLSI